MKKYKLILEFSEFNAQRMNSDSVQASVHVDNPTLSTNAFDKHEDIVRQSISRLGQLQGSMMGSAAYRSLKSKLSLDDQDVTALKIIRIVKNTNLNYDVFISFIIDGEEYWGVIKNILSNDAKLKSEVFKDSELIQTKEWIIKLEGFLLKNVLNFLKPNSGFYKQLKDDVICFSGVDGKMLKMNIGTEIEVLKSYNDKIIFRHDGVKYHMTGDNFVYFNWWFEKIDS